MVRGFGHGEAGRLARISAVKVMAVQNVFVRSFLLRSILILASLCGTALPAFADKASDDFNLGVAMYRNQRWDQASQTFEEFLKGYGFIRTHHSYLVNIDTIKMFDKSDGGNLILTSGHVVPVSQRKKDFVLQVLENR